MHQGAAASLLALLDLPLDLLLERRSVSSAVRRVARTRVALPSMTAFKLRTWAR